MVGLIGILLISIDGTSRDGQQMASLHGSSDGK